jgi:hypothetical protein
MSFPNFDPDFSIYLKNIDREAQVPDFLLWSYVMAAKYILGMKLELDSSSPNKPGITFKTNKDKTVYIGLNMEYPNNILSPVISKEKFIFLKESYHCLAPEVHYLSTLFEYDELTDIILCRIFKVVDRAEYLLNIYEIVVKIAKIRGKMVDRIKYYNLIGEERMRKYNYVYGPTAMMVLQFINEILPVIDIPEYIISTVKLAAKSIDEDVASKTISPELIYVAYAYWKLKRNYPYPWLRGDEVASKIPVHDKLIIEATLTKIIPNLKNETRTWRSKDLFVYFKVLSDYILRKIGYGH